MVFNSSMLMAGATANASSYTIPYSCRFVSGNSAYLEKTYGAAGNSRTWTFSAWVKRGTLGTRQSVFGITNTVGGIASYLQFDTGTASDQIVLNNELAASGASLNWSTVAQYRDVSAWYHIVWQFDTTQATAANRSRLWVNGVEVTSFTKTVTPALNDQCLLNNSTVYPHRIGRQGGVQTNYLDGYLSNVYFIDGQALTHSSFGQINTSGVWVPKAYAGTYGTNGFFLDYGNSSYLGYDVKTSGVTTKFTNSSEWTGDTGDFSSLAQNIVPTGGNTGGIRTNDTFTGDFAVQFQWQAGTNPAYLSVYDTAENATFNSATTDAGVNSMTNAFQMFFGAGSVVDAKRGVTGTVSAGIFTVAANDWIKLQRSGSTFTCYQNGTLKYTWVATSSATMRVVVSQASSSMDWRSFTWTAGSTTPANSFYASGLTSADRMSDTPTNNVATWNALEITAGMSISNGNTSWTSTGGDDGMRATLGVRSGKWEYQVKATSVNCRIGFATSAMKLDTYASSTDIQNAVLYYGGTGNWMGNANNTAYGATFTTNDIITCRIDFDGQTVTFLKNNTSQGTIAFPSYFSASGAVVFPAMYQLASTTGDAYFASDKFVYSIGTLHSAFALANLPAPAIKDGSAHFQIALHTGTGSAITINQSGNSTFTSDFVWTKGRSGATNHVLSNIISGTGKYLSSNATTAETTDAQALTAFGSGSISYGTLAAANTSAATYVDWMWKAGGAGVSNTSGSITSTVSANTTAGFSVVTYTGTGANATVGHGLGVTPRFIVVFRRDTGGFSHRVYHGSLGATAGGELFLDSTAAATTNSANWNNTDPTSSVFSIGTSTGMNASGGTYVAYCYAPIAGFSQFGSYTGNGSADGPFIYTGFKPAFVLIKRTDAAGSEWNIIDSSRPAYNPEQFLFADTAGAETTTYAFDILSNGFKWRQAAYNASGGTYVYAAFASNPFGGSGAAPATAR